MLKSMLHGEESDSLMRMTCFEWLEMHFVLTIKNILNLDIDDIEKRIDERRVVVEKKLAQI